MSGQNREIYAYAVAVAVLSVFMAVVLAFAWGSVYGQVTEIEALLLAEIPWITSGGIQITAMFGLGLFLSWATLFTLDWRKRYQGMMVLGGGLLVILVLAVFGHFLPHMGEHPVQNFVAFIAGTSIGLLTETIRLPGRTDAGDLFYIDFSESSLRPLHILADGREAEFPVATYGLYGLIVSVIVGANVALWVTIPAPAVALATLVVSVLYVFALYRLFKAKVTRSDLNLEIIGPQASGKTLFFYGVDKTVRFDDENGFEHIGTNTEWFHKMNDMETSDETWLTDFTEEYSNYAFAFRYGKLNRRLKMVLHDFPGERVIDVRDSLRQIRTRTDGGITTDEDEKEGQNWGRIDEVEDNDSATVSDATEADSRRRKEQEKEPKEQRESDAVQQAERNKQSEKTTRELDEEITTVDTPGDLAKELTSSDVLVVLLDTNKVIESGIAINPNDYPGKIGEDDKNKLDPEITTINEICELANPHKGVIAIASKADLLIKKYKKEKDKSAPHTAAGDFDEFTDFVDNFYSRIGTYHEFKSKHDINKIYPVYFQTSFEDGEAKPVKENGDLQPEGYEQVLDQIIKKS